MVFNPNLAKVLSNHLSRYSLVIATAKRAREISEEAEANGEILTEKPVSLALEEIVQGKIKVIEPEEIRYL
ncbi:MAG: DNA-directed RNA polymerase subunit omega [Ruminococcus sp.]|jgi:DNA-directed RNA polymerase subunit omega|nr:DNA-directed RNA polymerase subunit omega [Oscillospiraceae bacterium]MCI6388654.1 DNA-directed RNA polymerase subunit omega [Ruminococcus sp.]MDY4909529.1 DNA-directed RNA polymerase subunit omega [Candidatus Fimenecus sp.]MDD6271070.1 DNA-directed RNA polymerase subunit omega [Ruminococcus sp.]MDD7344307.1 DNA-directed RNA polymerase subunit omega [Ruminococcus sp.]